jgi:hypothetical protein
MEGQKFSGERSESTVTPCDGAVDVEEIHLCHPTHPILVPTSLRLSSLDFEDDSDGSSNASVNPWSAARWMLGWLKDLSGSGGDPLRSYLKSSGLLVVAKFPGRGHTGGDQEEKEMESPLLPWMGMVLGVGSDILHKFCVEKGDIDWLQKGWRAAMEVSPWTMTGIMAAQESASLRKCRPADWVSSTYLVNSQGVYGTCVNVELCVFGAREICEVFEGLKKSTWSGPKSGFPWMGMSYRTSDDFIFCTGYDACPVIVSPLELELDWDGSPEMSLARVIVPLTMESEDPDKKVRNLIF